jgi:dephospho-CoA kinase
MVKQKSLSIVAFVGLTGSGKTTASAYLAQLGAPRITTLDTTEIVDEITHIAEAGQRLIVIDDIASWEQYRAVKHAFPGRFTVVALTSQTNIRHRRLGKRQSDALTIHQAEEQDREILAASQKAEPIAAADYTIINDGAIEDLHANIDEIVATVRACTAGRWC